MKTIKSIFAIAAIALTSVFGFTSCDKNDDAFNQPVQPVSKTVVEMADGYLCIPVVEGQMEYMDAIYNVSVDGQNKQIKFSDMTEMKDANRLKAAYNGKKMGEAFNDVDEECGKDKFVIYEYNIGKAFSARINSIVYSSKGKLVDKEHEINIMAGYEFINVRDSKDELRYLKGINDLEGFCETTNMYYK